MITVSSHTHTSIFCNHTQSPASVTWPSYIPLSSFPLSPFLMLLIFLGLDLSLRSGSGLRILLSPITVPAREFVLRKAGIKWLGTHVPLPRACKYYSCTPLCYFTHFQLEIPDNRTANSPSRLAERWWRGLVFHDRSFDPCPECKSNHRSVLMRWFEHLIVSIVTVHSYRLVWLMVVEPNLWS